MPPVSRFGGGNRATKKQTIIDKLTSFFERFFGIGDSNLSKKEKSVQGTMYVEPDDYFPESIRKEMKIGEYSDDDE